MSLRVTLQSTIQTAIADSQRLNRQLADLQTQSSTGKKFQNISDNPVDAGEVLRQNSRDRTLDAHLANISTSTSALNNSVGILQQVSQLFSTARSIAVQAANSTNDVGGFEALATQVDSLIDQLLTLSNTKYGGRFLFGGDGAVNPPFRVAAADPQGKPTAIAYTGSSEATAAVVGTNQSVPLHYAGDDIFFQHQRGTPKFQGSTGAAPGSGTNSSTAREQLLISHVATTYAAGSGVAPGASSAAGDTILGPAGAHQLTIVDTSGTGVGGTVSLDGGIAVNFTTADTNLRVVNAAGDIVYIDMSSITPGFNGDVAITSTGVMSTDGGATTTPITFSAGQYIVDSGTSQITFVDTTGVTRTGTETVDNVGAYNAFQALMALRDDLRNGDHLSLTEQTQAISGDLAELERIQTSILDIVGQQSASLSTLDVVQTHFEDLQLSIRKRVSDLSDADVADIVLKLQSYNQMLQLTYAAFSRVVSTNLLDFLR